MTDAVTGDAEAVTRNTDAARARRKRARRRMGLKVRAIVIERQWLDSLEDRGYLDPFERGNAAAEIAAVTKFLGHQLDRR